MRLSSLPQGGARVRLLTWKVTGSRARCVPARLPPFAIERATLVSALPTSFASGDRDRDNACATLRLFAGDRPSRPRRRRLRAELAIERATLVSALPTSFASRSHSRQHLRFFVSDRAQRELRHSTAIRTLLPAEEWVVVGSSAGGTSSSSLLAPRARGRDEEGARPIVRFIDDEALSGIVVAHSLGEFVAMQLTELYACREGDRLRDVRAEHPTDETLGRSTMRIRASNALPRRRTGDYLRPARRDLPDERRSSLKTQLVFASAFTVFVAACGGASSKPASPGQAPSASQQIPTISYFIRVQGREELLGTLAPDGTLARNPALPTGDKDANDATLSKALTVYLDGEGGPLPPQRPASADKPLISWAMADDGTLTWRVDAPASLKAPSTSFQRGSRVLPDGRVFFPTLKISHLLRDDGTVVQRFPDGREEVEPRWRVQGAVVANKRRAMVGLVILDDFFDLGGNVVP